MLLKRLSTVLFLFVVMAGLLPAYAQFDDFSSPFDAQPSFLPIEEAFEFDFQQNGDQLVVTFDIADGYYLYKKQFSAKVKDAALGEPVFPQAEQIEDEFFGISDVFYGSLSFSYPIEKAGQDAVVALRYQGCAKAGLCYPPSIHKIYLSQLKPSVSSSPPKQKTVSSQYELAEDLASSEGLLITLLGFFGLGALLAFTPCVFPMYPILSSIVIGQGKETSLSKAFWLSFIYVQGMAITYSILGVVVASAGVQFQAALQHPLLLSIFIVLFVVLSMAMFGAYELQLPSSWQVKLNQVSNKQKQGNAIGVFVMGVLSGLVASPCTTAPLTAILLYIAQSGDMFLGFIALYILSIGMGIPLILFGMTGGKLLPKAGGWMNIVKTTFGFMMLAVAILFIERMWISPFSMLLYAVLGLSAFSYYFVINSHSQPSFMKGVRAFGIFIGLFASAIIGYRVIDTHILGSIDNSANSKGIQHAAEQKETTDQSAHHGRFIQIKDLPDFSEKLKQANEQGKTVMVDLYADWCVACKEFESRTFPKPIVKEALRDTVLMQIDLTATSETNFEFQQAFDVLGLPTILFFDENGNEIPQSRITGFMKAEPFAAHVNDIFN
jgi:thiol:disulfide interchange protein DsbD